MARVPFQDRAQAGSLLAEELKPYARKRDTIILALVRGGVAIGAALRDALGLPLYPYIVRKLGHPLHREYGLGAIAEGGATYLDEDAMRMMEATWEDLEPVIEEETAEMERRKSAYLTSARPPLKGKTVILTDDGAATGGTMLAAIQDVRAQGVKKVIVALPVSPLDTERAFEKQADEVSILANPEPFEAVGKWYRDFPQLTDEDVITLLQKDSVLARPTIH
ncbi:MAG: phosphoribosyltransferase family protein [Candidatus Peregrinibacteria bacterium]|nr:phosphoribosyltransferase family protein [Candidatus Peregrinibacteria bacterium]